jgi:hypothetical protein
MSKILLGKSGKAGAWLEIDELVRTRLLIQGNSGSGKSWLIRRLCEQLFGKIPVIVIDSEGEFASLRERFGYVLVGKGGEAAAHPETAGLLAHRLLELKAWAICDIYELKPPARHRWVKNFLEAMVDAPKNLWHPTVIIVDEAHVYAPEKGQGESEAQGAMVDMATRGRKRGFCLVPATQRLSKLAKNLSAEMLNRLVGMTFEDIDLDRAADLLSVSRSDRPEFQKEMRNLAPGRFYGLGRAISKERLLIDIGPVETSHPEPGSAGHASGPPPTPEKIKALLPKLQDLPKEAEQKARTEAEFKKEIQSLKAQVLTLQRQPQPKPAVQTMVKPVIEKVSIPLITDAQLKQLKAAADALSSHAKESGVRLAKAIQDLGQHIKSAIDATRVKAARPSVSVEKILPPKRVAAPMRRQDPDPAAANSSLLAGERKMLGVLAQFHPGSRTKSQLGALSGYTPSGGTFGQYYGKLKRLKLVKEGIAGEISITEAGLEWFGGEIPEGPKSVEELLEMWRGKLLQGERKMLDTLVEAYPAAMTKEELGEKSGYMSSGGTFGQYLGTLRRNGLVSIDGDDVKAAETLFDMAAA